MLDDALDVVGWNTSRMGKGGNTACILDGFDHVFCRNSFYWYERGTAASEILFKGCTNRVDNTPIHKNVSNMRASKNTISHGLDLAVLCVERCCFVETSDDTVISVSSVATHRFKYRPKLLICSVKIVTKRPNFIFPTLARTSTPVTSSNPL